MADMDLAVKLTRVATAAVENGQMRHDVGLLLVDAIDQHRMKASTRVAFVNVYATRLPEFEGFEAAAFDTLEDARENAAENADETLAVGALVQLA